MILLYDVPETSNHLFPIYHPHYQKNLEIIELTNELVTHLATFIFACNSGACTAQIFLVDKKTKLPKTCSIYIINI